jgi:hypothetical protein
MPSRVGPKPSRSSEPAGRAYGLHGFDPLASTGIIDLTEGSTAEVNYTQNISTSMSNTDHGAQLTSVHAEKDHKPI